MPEMKTLTVNGTTYDLRDDTKAPAGYGWGETKGMTVTDYNTCVLGGFYNGNNAVNGPSFISNAPYANVVVSRGNTKIYQTMYSVGKIAHRYSSDNGVTWEPWVDIGPTAYAPAGYGLGGIGQSVADLNAATKSGWYYTHTTTANTPTAYGAVLTMNRANKHIVQLMQDFNGQAMLRRHSSDSGATWTEEYLNPSMALGVEYCTFEQWQDKPVYVKLIKFGALPNADYGSVNIGVNASNVIGVNGIVRSSGYTEPFPPIASATGVAQLSWWISGVELNVRTQSDMSNYTAFVTVKYVKD